MNTPFSLSANYLLAFCLLALVACKPKAEDNANSEAALDAFFAPYANVLSMEGAPQQLKDRSVNAFMDQGAWFGYSQGQSNAGGAITGPYHMGYKGGRWVSKSMAEFFVREQDKPRLDWRQGKVANTYYPWGLQQTVTLPQWQLTLTQTFVDQEHALIVAALTYKGFEPVTIIPTWAGSNFDSLWAAKGSGSTGSTATSLAQDVEHFTTREYTMAPYGENIELMVAIAGQANEAAAAFDDKHFVNELQPETFQPGETHEYPMVHYMWFNEGESAVIDGATLQAIMKNRHQHILEAKQRWKERLEPLVSRLPDTTEQRLAVKCAVTMVNNWKGPAGDLPHAGVVPSYHVGYFDGYWAWDSWKHAVALVQFIPWLAKDQVRAMFDFVNEKGMVEDAVYRRSKNNFTLCTKPPLASWAVWEVFTHTQDTAFVAELYPQLKRYHYWRYAERDRNNNGLCEYGTMEYTEQFKEIPAKWESGMDNAVRFDGYGIDSTGKGTEWTMPIESVELNAYLIWEKEQLAALATVLGQADEAAQFTQEVGVLKPQFHERFWNEEEGYFFDYDWAQNAPIKVFGPEGWSPLFTQLASTKQAEAVKNHMMDTAKFNTHVPLPTLDASHPRFDPYDGYWRGPVWLDQAGFGIMALRNYGYMPEADALQHKLLHNSEGMLGNKPLPEHYHPQTGEILRARHFSWSAAHLIMLLLQQQPVLE